MSSLPALTPTRLNILGANTLGARLFPSFQNLSVLKVMVLAFLGTILLTFSAKMSIPFYPVPTTMQTFAVIFLGCVYGSRLAAATVALYVFEGAMGFPVFQGPAAGFVYLAGPTAGYLLGFIAAAYGVGLLFEKGFGRSILSAALLFVIGAVIIDVPGLIWLSNLMGIEATKVVYLSYQYAFLLKTGLGALIIPALWHHHSMEKQH